MHIHKHTQRYLNTVTHINTHIHTDVNTHGLTHSPSQTCLNTRMYRTHTDVNARASTQMLTHTNAIKHTQAHCNLVPGTI
jgi:hypothetical protein